MKTKKCSLRMVRYEMRNINGNLMPHFFGIIFPNMMSPMIAFMVKRQMPESMWQEAVVSVAVCMSLVIPMSIMFLGYGAIYSQEVEHEIPLRMRLFGFSEKAMITAKMIAHLIFLTIAFVIYAVTQTLILDIVKPAFPSLLCLLLSIYLIGVLFLIIVHSIANICKRFSVTFGISMFAYFTLMMLTGMMGISTEQLPKAVQKVARLFPMTYICNDFADFWQGGEYNFMPYIQSCIFLAACTGILVMYAQYRNRRMGRETGR